MLYGKLIAFCCFCMMTFGLFAETLAWWRMEGAVDGNVSAVPSEGGEAEFQANKSPDNFGAVYKDSFDAALMNAEENDSCLYLPNANNLDSGCLTVADNEKLRPSGDFTVEAFFKWSCEYTLQSGASAGIFGKVRDEPVSCTYGVGLSGDTIVGRFYSGSDELLTTSDVKPQDGKWHHVAITYEAASRKARLWVDYVLRVEKVLSGNLVYASGAQPFKIGSIGARTFTGMIDEVRISESALSPDRFLEARLCTGSLTDPGELKSAVYRYRFGDGEFILPDAEWETTNTCAWRANQMGNGFGDVEKMNFVDFRSGFLSCEGGAEPALEDDVTASRCYFSMCRTNSFENASSASFVGGGYYTFKLDSPDSIVKSDFTVECYFKAKQSVQYGTFVGQLSGVAPNPYLPLWKIGTSSGGKLVFSYAQKLETGVAQVDIEFGEFFHVGKWYHLAAVYTAADHKVRLYANHKLLKEQVLENALYGVGLSQTMRIGQRDGGMDVLIDEVRISNEALDAADFMCAYATPSIEEGSVIAHYGFDRSWSNAIGAYSTIAPAETGLIEGVEGAAYPAFVDDVKAPFVFDGKSFWTNDAFSANTASLMVSTGIVRIAESPVHGLNLKSFTAECFLKFERDAPMVRWANIVDVVRADGTPVWTIRVDEGGRLSVFINKTEEFHAAQNAKALNDGRWHHVALTCDEDEESGELSISLSVDYAEYVSGKTSASLAYEAGGEKTVVRFGAPNGIYFQRFFVDEFRYTAGVKNVADFIKLRRGGYGSVILVK